MAVRGGCRAVGCRLLLRDRSIYAAEGGYALSRRKLAAVVAIGFSGLFDTGGPARAPPRRRARGSKTPSARAEAKRPA